MYEVYHCDPRNLSTSGPFKIGGGLSHVVFACTLERRDPEHMFQFVLGLFSHVMTIPTVSSSAIRPRRISARSLFTCVKTLEHDSPVGI